jgi:hypothetical protein
MLARKFLLAHACTFATAEGGSTPPVLGLVGRSKYRGSRGDRRPPSSNSI